MQFPRSSFKCLSLGLLGALACSGTPSSDKPDQGNPQSQKPLEPGTSITAKHPTDITEEWAAVRQALSEVADVDAAGLRQRYPSHANGAFKVDAKQATHYGLVQGSALALNNDEASHLDQEGFVITDRVTFPGFPYGYLTIYGEDLPVYVTADSIMHAVHRSYDDILKAIETGALIPTLDAMLTGMRAGIQAGALAGFGNQTAADADLYTAVALSLLRGTPVDAVAGANKKNINDIVDKAETASGWINMALFGVSRDMDFSQFTPRGHYTDSEELSRYFKAMMWLGRIDLRPIETQPDGSQVFHRRQFDAAVALALLVRNDVRKSWQRLDRTIEGFVGESDNMTLPELEKLLAELKVIEPEQLKGLTDDAIATAIMAGGYGVQRIASHIMVAGPNRETLPLSRAFLLLGQRYVVDSHVFSNVVFDRVQNGAVKRMMPDPLDAAFAALGNNHAAVLLDAELTRYPYAPDLAAMRVLADAHENEFWSANLYNLWLTALRTLSPNGAGADRPAVTRTDAWGRRILNTQLASWAELRHDTILYAKQSYTGGIACTFPDAYVDPYPAFYAALVDFAERAQTIVSDLDFGSATYLKVSVDTYFGKLKEVATVLGEMAQNQQMGMAPSAAHMEFINQAVQIYPGCGDPALGQGWYADLFFDKDAGAEFDPTIADVHTQPTDENGVPVGHVLHVATGRPRLMVVVVDTAQGLRTYVGLASSYFEHITEKFDRLTDEAWAEKIRTKHPADVTWMRDLVRDAESSNRPHSSQDMCGGDLF